MTERINTLGDLGLRYSAKQDAYLLKDISVPLVDVKTLSQGDFDSLAEVIRQRVQEYKSYYSAPDAEEPAAENLPAVVDEPEDKDVKMFVESLSIFQGAPQVLKENKLSVTGAKAAIQKIYDAYTANGNKMNAELDAQAKDLLIKINATIKSMNGKRSGFTQLASALSKQFTTLEAELDPTKAGTEANKIQKLRDDWAKFCIEEGERKRKEAQAETEKQKQKAELKGWIIQKIGELLANYLFTQKQAWNNSFNAITLADYDTKAAKLTDAPCAFNNTASASILQYNLPFSRLSDEDKTTVQRVTHEEYDFTSWIATYNREMAELKQTLIDRLPSKKTELEAAAEAERERQQELQRQQEAERHRQETIAKANAEEKERLEKQAEIDRENERKRREQLDAEKNRQDEERRQREDEERRKMEDEKKHSELRAKESGNLATASMTAASLFDQAAAVSETANTPEARTGYDIAVLHPAGWVEIFQFWYQREGVKLSVEESGKKSLNQMKKFVEAVAKKDDVKIESKYLKYTIAVKAINRKED
jgi:septal ring factor EnvC (AmiA/AmiB activator)